MTDNPILNSSSWHSLNLIAIFIGLLFALVTSLPATCVAQDSDAARKLEAIASTAQNNEDYELAAQQWEKLLTQSPKSTLVSKAQFNAGKCYAFTQDFEQAIEKLKLAVASLGKEDSQLADAYLYLGFAQYRLGQQLLIAADSESDAETSESTKEKANIELTTSTRTFARLLELFPKYPDADQACYFQGGAFEELDRLKEAETAYTKMLTFPKQTYKMDGLFASGYVQERLGNFSNAVETYDKFRSEAEQGGGGKSLLDEVNFRTANALLRLAIADRARQDSESATSNTTRAYDLFSSLAEQDKRGKSEEFLAMSDEAQYQQAYCKTQLDEFEAAAVIYEKVAARPGSKFINQSLVYAGLNYDKAGKASWAVAALKKAIESNSESSFDGAVRLSNLYLRTKEFQKAFDVADAWIGKGGDSPLLPSLLMDRADSVYQMDDRRAESPTMFMELADQFPKHKLAPSAIYNAAYAQLELNDLDGAIASATRFEKEYSNSDFLADTLEVKADALLINDQAAESAKVFEQLATTFPDRSTASRWNLRSGLARYLQEDYQSTIDWLKPKLDLFSGAEKSEALHWIGSSHFQLEQFDEAASQLQASADVETKWRRADETLLTLARSLYKADAGEEANGVAQKLIQDFPTSGLAGDARYYMGESQYENKNFQDALDLFRTVIEKYSDSKLVPYSLYNAAWCEHDLKDYETSEKTFSKLIAAFPDHELHDKAKIGRGSARRKMGKMDGSIADLKSFLEKNPTGQPKFNALYELGLAHVEQKQWPAAISVFEQLLSENGTATQADYYHYELAWAYQSKNLPSNKNGTRSVDPDALKHFTTITTEFPESSLAPESNFHIASDFYQNAKFDDAIVAYKKCVDSEAAAAIREKAAYKLGWAHYKQEQYEDSQKEFNRQVELFPQGDLFADGAFMVAESWFRLDQYDKALAAYMVAQPVVDAAKNVDPKIRILTRLHGAQSANKTRKYNDALRLASELTTPESLSKPNADSFQYDAWLEVGTAQEGNGNSEEALKAWRLASQSDAKTGARSRCMIGDLFFKQKNFAEAITEFKLVYYGFGGTQAANDVRPWQAYALYEAARCNFVQVDGATAESKPKLIEEAKKQFDYLIKNYSNDRLAPEAKKQLETLTKLSTK